MALDEFGAIIFFILGLVFLILISALLYSIFIILTAVKKNRTLGVILSLLLIITLYIAFNGNIGPFITYALILAIYGLARLIILLYKKISKKSGK